MRGASEAAGVSPRSRRRGYRVTRVRSHTLSDAQGRSWHTFSVRCAAVIPVRLQGYFCRAGDAPGKRTIDPQETFSGGLSLRRSNPGREEHNLAIEYRAAEGQLERLPELERTSCPPEFRYEARNGL